MEFDFQSQKGTGLEELLIGVRVSKDCLNLLKSLLIYNPKERITATEAINHRYFHENIDLEKSFKYLKFYKKIISK